VAGVVDLSGSNLHVSIHEGIDTTTPTLSSGVLYASSLGPEPIEFRFYGLLFTSGFGNTRHAQERVEGWEKDALISGEVECALD
jgi:hypothetical protein